MDGYEAEEVGEYSTEGCFSVQAGTKRSLTPADQDVQEGHAVVAFYFVSEFDVLVSAVHVVQELLMVCPIPTQNEDIINIMPIL